MHQRHDVDLVVLERLLHLFRPDDLAPGGLDLDEVPAQALDDVRHAGAEDAVHADQHPVALFDEVHEAGLHARAPGARHREGQLVVRVEQPAQHGLAFFHDLEEFRVQMTDDGGRQRLQNPWMRVAGAGSEKNSSGRVQR